MFPKLSHKYAKLFANDCTLLHFYFILFLRVASARRYALSTTLPEHEQPCCYEVDHTSTISDALPLTAWHCVCLVYGLN